MFYKTKKRKITLCRQEENLIFTNRTFLSTKLLGSQDRSIDLYTHDHVGHRVRLALAMIFSEKSCTYSLYSLVDAYLQEGNDIAFFAAYFVQKAQNTVQKAVKVADVEAVQVPVHTLARNLDVSVQHMKTMLRIAGVKWYTTTADQCIVYRYDIRTLKLSAQARCDLYTAMAADREITLMDAIKPLNPEHDPILFLLCSFVKDTKTAKGFPTYFFEKLTHKVYVHLNVMGSFLWYER